MQRLGWGPEKERWSVSGGGDGGLDAEHGGQNMGGPRAGKRFGGGLEDQRWENGVQGRERERLSPNLAY